MMGLAVTAIALGAAFAAWAFWQISELRTAKGIAEERIRALHDRINAQALALEKQDARLVNLALQLDRAGIFTNTQGGKAWHFFGSSSGR